MSAAQQQRCEVCDDTNASIRCQECRRNTCEECDEILHLVDTNKSHHRVPLFPTRSSQSHNASYASSRNLSPRNSARWSKNDEDNHAFMPRVEASADIDRQIREANIGSGAQRTETLPVASSLASRPAEQAPQSRFSDSVPSRSILEATSNGGVVHHPPARAADQEQAQRSVQDQLSRNQERPGLLYSQPAQQIYTTPDNVVSKPRPPVTQLNPQPTTTRQAGGQEVYTARQPPQAQKSSADQPVQTNLAASGQRQVRQYEPTSRFQQMSHHQSPANQEASQPSSMMATPTRQPHPLQAYSQASSTTTTQQWGVPNSQQYGGARSHAHSGAATPTVPTINAAQNYNATGGAIPLSRWQDRQTNGVAQQQVQPTLAQQYRSSEELPISRTSLDSKQGQAYLQHMQVLEQHRAVEAHQRMTAISRQQQQQFGYAAQPAVSAQAGYQQMGHVTPSMRHTMGHTTPSLGQRTAATLGHHSLGHTTPSMGQGYSNMGYHSMGSTTPSMGHGLGHVTPSYPHPASVSYSGGVQYPQPSAQDQRFRFPSQAIVAQAGPNVVTWPNQMRQPQASTYPHPAQHHQQQVVSHSMADPGAARQYQSAYPGAAFAGRSYHEAKTLPPERTLVYASVPRTPYKEPRSPAAELVGWSEGNYHALSSYATAPRAAPSPARGAPQSYQGQGGQPVHAQPTVAAYPSPSLSTPSTMVQAKQPSPVDEAEARVRNLIADTERMLAGLSTYS